MTAARETPYSRSRPHSPPRRGDPSARPSKASAGGASSIEKNTAPRRRSRFGTAMLVLLLLMIAAALFSLVVGVFAAMLKLHTVTVEWPADVSKTVTDESVVLSSGLRAGDRLYAIDGDALEAKILRAHPYLASVRIEYRLPDTLAIICTPREAAYYIAVGGEWFAVSTDLAVLEESADEEGFSARGLVPIILPEVRSAVVGQRLSFVEPIDPSYITALLSDHYASPLWASTDLLRVESRFDVRMIVRGSYALTLGDSRDISLKLELGEKILEDELFGANSGAFIDLSDPTEGSVILDKQTDYTRLWRS